MTYPAIPEGCERFKSWHRKIRFHHGWVWIRVDHAADRDSGWPKNVWRDLCNAARCAWLDEAERCKPIEKYIPGTVMETRQREIDHAHCLALAEAWAREGRRETDKD